MTTFQISGRAAFWIVVWAFPFFSLCTLSWRARADGWRTPRWFLLAAAASAYVAAVAWLRGLAVYPVLLVTLSDVCASNAQYLNDEYREDHHDEYVRLFPLHARCNADFDLVPSWVNPTVGLCLVLLAISLIGLVRTVRQSD